MNKKETVICICIWLLGVLLYFAPSVFEDKVIAPLDIYECVTEPYATRPIEDVHNHFTADAITQYLPYNYSVAKSIEEDGYIGWNPYTHNGTAITENTMLCPGDWHHWLYYFCSFWAGWDWGIILQFFIAGLGMLLLLKSQQFNTPYCVLGATAYGFYSQFVLWIYHRWVLGTMCWGPWVVWALLRNREKKHLIDPFSIIFIALGIRGGHLQAAGFILLLMVCMLIADWWQSENRKSISNFIKLSFPYIISGIGACLLSIDVLCQSIPPFLEDCRNLPFYYGIFHLPSLISSIFPTILGTANSIDLFKIFKETSLFDLKFYGSTLFILSILGLLNKQAPKTAKILVIISLALVFTPLFTWLYSRSTTVFAIGAIWLAIWQLKELTQNISPHPAWRKILWGLGGVTIVWILASIIITLFEAPISEKLTDVILGQMSARDAGREAWFTIRVDRFLAQCCLWHPLTFSLTALLWIGVILCSKLHRGYKHNTLFIWLIALCCLGEHLLMQHTWVQYADKPESEYLYNPPAWLTKVKEKAKDGSVLTIRSRKDYINNNTLSGLHIKQAKGYETVQPKYLCKKQFTYPTPEQAVKASISLILVDPKCDIVPSGHWILEEDSLHFRMYSNPLYRGRFFITDYTGKEHVIRPTWQTRNKIHFNVPAHSTSLHILESYHHGWSATDSTGNSIPITCTNDHGILIEFINNPTAKEIILQYKNPHQNYYYILIGITSLVLIPIICYRRKRN